MIDELYTQVLQDTLQLRGEGFVLDAGLCLSSGMGVGKDQPCCIRLDEEEADQLAWIDGCPVHCTLGEPYEAEEVAAGVQGDSVEPFDGFRVEESSQEELGLLHSIHWLGREGQGVAPDLTVAYSLLSDD